MQAKKQAKEYETASDKDKMQTGYTYNKKYPKL